MGYTDPNLEYQREDLTGYFTLSWVSDAIKFQSLKWFADWMKLSEECGQCVNGHCHVLVYI